MDNIKSRGMVIDDTSRCLLRSVNLETFVENDMKLFEDFFEVLGNSAGPSAEDLKLVLKLSIHTTNLCTDELDKLTSKFPS